jgi:CDP-diacylglycerol--serine O-phosphatidyltransferase
MEPLPPSKPAEPAVPSRRPPPRSRLLVALPSSITLLGVLGGFLCLIWAPTEPYLAGCAIIGASLCDMIDGRVARLTGTSSAFGVQLDSRADLASFGIAPAFLAYHWALASRPGVAAGVDVVALLVFLYVVACAVRLARFNVDATSDSGPGFFMKGLPSPVAALALTTMTMASIELDLAWLGHPALVIGVSLGLSALMVTTLPFPSYKRFKSRPRQLAFFASIMAGLTLLIAGGPGGAVLFGLLALYVVVGLGTALIARRPAGPRVD